MRIRYNAPVTITLALFATVLLGLDQLFSLNLIPRFFAVPSSSAFSFQNPLHIASLFTHICGHVSWTHLLGNFSFILLLGPILEEKYGSPLLFLMMLITAGITGSINALFLSTGLLGASGIVFMLILLVSFTNYQNGEIPITFFLIVILFLTKEIINSFEENSISEMAHIVGGSVGAGFGFLLPRKKQTPKKSPKKEKDLPADSPHKSSLPHDLD